ncbi:MAG: hypothetical protein HYW91_02845 [Candidatus Sungbacteria bacterium]|nr:hypothetical protein [Candidatus Sungbacteria bacterium]
MVKLLLAALAILAVLIAYRAIEESNIVRGVTIVVQTPDRMPIPYTIVRLGTTDGKVTIQNQTDKDGKLNFRELTKGTYYVLTTQVYCDGGKRGVQAMTITIGPGLNNLIHYFPCG